MNCSRLVNYIFRNSKSRRTLLHIFVNIMSKTVFHRSSENNNFLRIKRLCIRSSNSVIPVDRKKYEKKKTIRQQYNIWTRTVLGQKRPSHKVIINRIKIRLETLINYVPQYFLAVGSEMREREK